MRRAWLLVLTFLFAGAAVSAGFVLTEPSKVKGLPLVTLGCNGHVTKSMRLAADVGPNCPATGLTIDGNGITLDLNGHTVDGDDGGEYGIVINSKNHVTVLNGTITDFFGGLTVQGGSRDAIRGLRATSNTQYGIQFIGENSTVSHNFVFANPIGIYSSGSFDRIVGNTAQSNSDGIEISSGHSNLIKANHVVSNSGTGIIEGYNLPRFDNTVTQNVADSNDTDGIKIQGEFAHVSKNVANHNTGLGIDAVAGTLDGGGNKASGNSNSHQCENVVCS